MFLLLFFLLSSTAIASDWEGFGPVSNRIQNPLYLQTLGLTPQAAKTLKKGDLSFRIDSSYSNMFEYEEKGADKINLDMELWRIGLNFVYGLKDGFEIGAELPFYDTWGGFLDPFIQKFHKTFGFPNGGRDKFPNNEFHYYFKRNGAVLFDYPSQKFSIGDFKISFKNEILKEGRYNPLISWFSEIKFPTGDERGGVGTRACDFGLGIALQKTIWRFHTYFNGEYLLIGGNDIFGDDINLQSFAYLVGFEFSILPTWSAIVQLNGATPLYSGTSLDAFNGVPLDLLVGFRGEEKDIFKGSDLFWQFGFAEDVTSKGPSVDFSVLMSIGMKLKK